jgi:putative transposase
MDMASRRVVGFALGEHHDAALAYSAPAMAVAVRGGQVPGVIMHTDQGSEYTAGLVRQACARPGSALDNAVIESWHSTLEFELRRSRTSRPGLRPGPGSAPGSRITTPGGTPRWA